MDYNNELKNLIIKNCRFDDVKMLFLQINENATLTLRISKNGYIEVRLLSNINDSPVFLSIPRFNSDENIEKIQFTYKSVPFSFIVYKKSTTRKNIAIIDREINEEDEDVKQVYSQFMQDIEEVAKDFIMLLLLRLGLFLEQYSVSLRIEDFGYVNFK